LDFGAVFGSILVKFIFSSNPNYLIKLPFWALNPVDGEGCAPDYYLKCKGNAEYGNAFNHTYVISEDSYCNSIQFGGDKSLLAS
jgi:hypothetical protein